MFNYFAHLNFEEQYIGYIHEYNNEYENHNFYLITSNDEKVLKFQVIKRQKTNKFHLIIYINNYDIDTDEKIITDIISPPFDNDKIVVNLILNILNDKEYLSALGERYIANLN